MKSFLIIGMGTFGHHLCRALCKLKCEVMIADQNGEALEDMLPTSPPPRSATAPTSRCCAPSACSSSTPASSA